MKITKWNEAWRRGIAGVLAVVMLFGMLPHLPDVHVHAQEAVEASAEAAPELEPLYQTIPVKPGQLLPDPVEVVENEIYGYVVDYELKKGHVLSISNTDYVFSVRKLVNGNYSTMLKQATVDSFTATEDMTVAMLIRKPDKSALTAEELAGVVVVDTLFGMENVSGTVHRFTVEAETIDGGTATTRAAIFLPPSYSEDGNPTRLIIMTNGGSAYLTESSWQGNTELNRNLVETYLQNGYAVLVNDNTAGKIVNNANEMVPDLGCLQQLSGLIKSYEHICKVLNLERKFSIHARSQGTFVGIRIMREYPELVKCALITGPNVSAAHRWTVITNKDHTAKRFGFSDLTGNTFEADKFVGNDIYTDMAADDYSLPPTFWMESNNDVCPNNNKSIYEVVERLRELGCTAEYQKFSDLTHSETCRLASDEAITAALAFLEAHQDVEAGHRYTAWTVTKEATCAEAGEMRRDCADCDHYEVMKLEALPGHISAETQEICIHCGKVLLDPLSQTVPVIKGQFSDTNGVWQDSDIYGCVIGYELKKGHTLTISDSNYVFAVRKLVESNYNTLVREASSDSFTATEDMTVAIRVRKPDKSAVTAEELAAVVLYDTQYGMQGVEGYAQRFYVDAETIDGGTASTRCNIFLPASYSEDGEPTKLIVMTNGHSAYLKDNVWNGNTADNVGIIRNYLNAGYAVWVVNNTADSTSRTTDIGCPQLVSSYLEAYEYIQEHFNVEKKFSIHSRSFGTFSAVRIMLEVPELVNCAVMTGPRVSIKLAWTANKSFVAKRFGFDDTTGATYEADKMVGHDPYTDVNGESYSLPPTFWMMCQGDATAEPLVYIDKLIAHGNDVTSATYTGTDHTGICTLNQEHMFADALAYLEGHRTVELPEGYSAVEYVESHGQEWIDTGVIPTEKTRSEVDYQVTVADPTASMGIYGSYKTSRHQLLYSLAPDQMTYGVGKGAVYTQLDTQRHFVVLDAKNASVTVDGIQEASDNGNSFTSAAGTASIYLFGAHQASEYSSYARIYGVSIYEDDVLIHRYVPCYGEAAMEYGMYDVVEGVFYGNSSGAGMLTGPDSTGGVYVTLTAPEAVTVAVYSGFDEETTGSLVCVKEETADGLTTYFYELPVGKYHFVAQGSGYYTLHKNFIVTREELAEGGKKINANPGLMSEDGKYECKNKLYAFTDELLASELMSVDSLLEKYPNLLDTPGFSGDKAFAQFTSQEDMESFISALDTEEDDLYVYTAGKTGKGKNIYLTVHTQEDLSGMTMEEAAEAVRANGKPIVCLYGLIHGLEPSGGEGPLAVIQALDGAYGEEVLDQVNVIVMPWINGDGAEKYLYGTPTGCANLNRYNLTVEYPEVQATHVVYNLFLPEVVISAHERRFQIYGGLDETGTLIDASLDISVNRNNTEQIRQLSKAMMKAVIETSAADGFRMDRHEQDNVSGQYPIVDSNYFGLRGSVSLLIEVPGIRSGKDLYERRVAAQFVSVKNIIDYVCENSQTVTAVVAADREAIAKRGSVFDPDALLTLRHGKNNTADWSVSTPVYYQTDGTLLDPDAVTQVVFWEEALVTRACPTAYVISGDAENLPFILQAADYNGIHYYQITGDETAVLRRYSGTVTAAVLGEEAEYIFENGAYVFPMDQPSANALAMLMEPDVYRTDSYAISFAQANKLAVSDIYRCEQNLLEGKIPTIKQVEPLSLQYDDHYDVSGKNVEIVDAGTPTSYKVGYGVEAGTLDDAVVTLDGNTLIATGIGTALVRIDGVLYEITVEAAPISLLLLIGQSNMEGMVGNANQSIACQNGQVYATYAKANGLTGDAGLTVDNAGDYVPSALTGAYSAVNVNGTDKKLSGYPVNSLTEAGAGKYGMDSAIAYEWTRQTGEKVWIVNAAHGASSISSWQKGQSNFEEACALLSACQEVLKKEIAAGHYTFSHMGYYWCQGCADETKTAQWYVSQYLTMHEDLKAELAFDGDLDLSTEDTTFEFGGIVLVMAGHETATGYRKGTYSDSADSFFASFKELEMRGPRVAQIWMANNPDLKDIHLVCTLAQDWVTMPDGTDGVEAYFTAHYENGVVDYPTQVKQSASWYAPKTPAAVKNSIHYYQVGYNEVGREAARNTLYILGLLEKPEIETTVSFLDWTGYQSVGTVKTSSVGSSETLVVPMVYPCYESKSVTYSVTDGLQYLYYDLLDTGVDGGTLTASVGDHSVTVTGREYYAYRFELVNGEMVSVADDIFRENVLTRNSPSTKTYGLTDTVVLKHNKPWTVEFNSVDAARFMALASTKGATDGMFYFFKSKSGSGVLSIGEYKDGLYQNYGLKQQQIGIDWTEPHIYRFQNVINADGTNIIHIYIDNEWVGTATNLIINDALQSIDNMYLSGKDLSFSSVGCGGFALDSDQMTYLEVWENGKKFSLPLRYDDRYDVTGKTVEIVDPGTPTSYKVGYGVAEGTLDDAVVALDGDTLIATGIGTALVRIDGQLYEVTVTAAPLSVFFLLGQSNMEGNEGNANQSIANENGQVYSTYGANSRLTVTTAPQFVPSALAGAYSTVNTQGGTAYLSNHPVNSLTEAGSGKIGMDSAIAYHWNKLTGDKVWTVNAAHAGSSISTWQSGKSNYNEFAAMFEAVKTTLQAELAAGHYTLESFGYLWCQGCAETTNIAQAYESKYLSMHEALKSLCTFDHDGDPATEDITLQFAGLVPIRSGRSYEDKYREGIYTDTTSEPYYESFLDLQMSGPRVAQFHMGNDPELADIHLVWGDGSEWVTMPDGTSGVSDYFQAYYEGGKVDYPTQTAQSDTWRTPTTAAAMHDSIHYNQIGYNELGIRAAENLAYILGRAEAPQEEVTVKFLSWDGYHEVTSVEAALTGSSNTLAVPVVYPIWKSKTVTYTLSDGLSYAYYDLLATTEDATGTLTAAGAQGTVAVTEYIPPEPQNYRWEFDGTDLASVTANGNTDNPVTRKAGTVTDGVISQGVYGLETSIELRHDRAWVLEWKTNGVAGSSTMGILLFSEAAKSATTGAKYIYFNLNKGICSMGYYTGSKHLQYGVSLTKAGITATEEHTYRLVNQIAEDGTNMVYLYVDGNEIGPMNQCYQNGSSALNTTENWVTGKNFSFAYFGTPENDIYDCKIHYMQAWENGDPNKSQLTDYKGKVISILSASTSTFAGYIPVADGFNLEHRPRYPQDNLLTDVNETWWMQVINELDAKLGINDSWAGSTVSNSIDGNSGDVGEDAAMASLTRIQNLGANGTPDVIFFFGGGNDMGKGVTLGTFDPAAAPTEVDLTATKWETFADAYVAAIMRMQYYYPDAEIVAMVTYAMPYYVTAEKLEAMAPVIEAICDHYGVTYVDMRDSGVTFDMLPDNVHPNAEGMDYITADVLQTLLRDVHMDAGENTVYTVTHELTNAKSALSYYKGVSHGKSFVTAISGGNLTVKVTMGGADITASVYTDGVVSIQSVTGDIVITAVGEFDADGHLQQLPEDVCAGVNLWSALEPENMYYTATGWGNTAAGTTWSITFPVQAGDRIWATSLGAYPENGSSANGVRVTWFDENGVLATLDRSVVYAEFAKYGYITAPEGAVALNLPMTNNQDHYAVYLLSAEHIPGEAVRENVGTDGSYESVVYCTVCGEELSREAVAGYTPGDINGDGSVDNKDLTRLFRYLSGYDVQVVEAALDVNGDGSINNKDQTRLFRYLSGWDVDIF